MPIGSDPHACRAGAAAVRLLGGRRVAARLGDAVDVRHHSPSAPASTRCGCATTSSSASRSTAGPPSRVRRLRGDHHPRRARARHVDRTAGHARPLRGAAPGVGARQGVGVTRRDLRRPARRRARRGLVRAGVPRHRDGAAEPRGAAGPPARRDRGVPGPARRRSVHLRRHVPPRGRRHQRAARGAASRPRRSSSGARATACSRWSPSSPTAGTRCGRGRPTAYRERVDVLERACERVGRDPATVCRSLGLYALCGEDEDDLRRRFDRLVRAMPGVLGGHDARRVARGSPRGHGRAGARAGGGVGGAGRGRARRGRGRGAVRRHRPRRRRDAGARPRSHVEPPPVRAPAGHGTLGPQPATPDQVASG